MSTGMLSLRAMSDGDLLTLVQRLAKDERQATARLIASLAELDARRLYLGEGCSSLFTYCTQVLHLSEHAAYGRIQAARAARKFPEVLDRLAHGEVTLTTIDLLAPHLTADNHEQLLDAARHKSKREVEQLVVRLRPQPDVPSTVRKLPPVGPAKRQTDTPPLPEFSTAAPSRPVPSPSVRGELPSARPVVAPLAPERYRIQFTASSGAYERLRRVQDLMRHRIPNGDIATIVDEALTLLLQHLERTKLAAVQKARSVGSGTAAGSRRIPAAVRRAVWARDGGQCAFIGTQGRCTERGFLEFHHVVPFADGGEPSVDNIELRCRAHNLHEAQQYFDCSLPLFVRELRTRYGESGNWVRTQSVRHGPASQVVECRSR